MEEKNQPFLIGLCGGTASGKTLLVNKLMETHVSSSVSVISMDNYYLSINEQKRDENNYVNFDLPEAIDINRFVTDVNKLIEGQSVLIREYNFNNDAIIPKKIEVKPAKILILEGIFVFAVKALMEKVNYKVYLHTDEELRLQRKIRRDMEERGMDMEWIMYQWENHTKPGQREYIEPYINDVDLRLDNKEDIQHSVRLLVDKINTILS